MIMRLFTGSLSSNHPDASRPGAKRPSSSTARDYDTLPGAFPTPDRLLALVHTFAGRLQPQRRLADRPGQPGRTSFADGRLVIAAEIRHIPLRAEPLTRVD
jgi:hypothetical protein